MAGLMIGSAIISSSLIVGDSLDQTVREEVEAAWGDTDVLISGFDATSGQVIEMPQSLVSNLRDAGLENIDYVQAGRVVSTSVVTAQELADPSVAWFALEHHDGVRIGSKEQGLTWFELEEVNRFSSSPQIVVNQVFADELEVDVGEEIQLVGMFETRTASNGLRRIFNSSSGSNGRARSTCRYDHAGHVYRSSHRSAMATGGRECDLHSDSTQRCQ